MSETPSTPAAPSSTPFEPSALAYVLALLTVLLRRAVGIAVGCGLVVRGAARACWKERGFIWACIAVAGLVLGICTAVPAGIEAALALGAPSPAREIRLANAGNLALVSLALCTPALLVFIYWAVPRLLGVLRALDEQVRREAGGAR